MFRKLLSLLIVLIVATTCVNIYLPSQANALTAQTQVNQVSAEQTEEGNVVWTVSTFDINGALKNGTPIKNSGRNTLIWERVGNQWLIAHEHVSTPFS